MTIRTFRQLAQGLGVTPAQVTYQIDGNTVFSGPVLTLNQPIPSLPNPELVLENIAWTWQEDADFSGTRSITITVSGSPLLLAATVANDPYRDVEVYGSFYEVEVGNVTHADPFTDETIDGVAQQSDPFEPNLAGQWWWLIPEGSTFAANLHVNACSQPYIVFDSIPSSINAGSTGTFNVRIPAISGSLPQRFVWHVNNETTVDSDFSATTGNVDFNTAESAFVISTTNSANAGVFRVQMQNLTGNSISLSQAVNIA